MKTVIALLLFPISLFAQKEPVFRRYPISNSGFSVYLPSPPQPFTVSYSPDSSSVTYKIESADSSTGSNYIFGAICMKLKKESIKGNEEEAITQYLEYIKKESQIVSAEGIKAGHVLAGRLDSEGVSDVWKTADGKVLHVMGWACESYLSILYVLGATKYPNEKALSYFTRGLRLP